MDQSTKQKEILTKLREAKGIYFIASMCTKQPYVSCSEETFDDEIFLFLSEDEAKEGAKKFIEKGEPVHVVRVEQQQMLTFYSGLYTMGINALVLGGEGEESVQLPDLVIRGDKNGTPENKVWVENPQLHLTALYFMQKLRIMKEPSLTPELAQLQEEILADFVKGTYIVPILEGNKVPLIRQKDETIYQPVFTDVLEFNRFNRENNMKSAVVGYDKMIENLAKEAAGVIVNPATIALQIPVGRRE